MLNFHTKGELQRLPGGAGRPPLGQLAWGLRHLAPTFSGWLGSTPGAGGAMLSIFHVLPRPAGLTKAGRPGSSSSSAHCCRVTLLQGLVMLLKSVRALVERFVTDCGPE